MIKYRIFVKKNKSANKNIAAKRGEPKLKPKRRHASKQYSRNSKLPNGAIFGVFYNFFKDTYANVERLPASFLPDEAIEGNPSMKFKPLETVLKHNNKIIIIVND